MTAVGSVVVGTFGTSNSARDKWPQNRQKCMQQIIQYNLTVCELENRDFQYANHAKLSINGPFSHSYVK